MQCHRRQTAKRVFQLSTQWRSSCSRAFPTSNSCVSETDQWFYPQLSNLLGCHIVTIKSMAPQSRKATGEALATGVVWGWWDKHVDSSQAYLFLCGQSVCLSSLWWHRKVQRRQKPGEGCWHKWPTLLYRESPFYPGRSQQALDWCQNLPAVSTLVSLKETVRFNWPGSPSSLRTRLTQE